MRLLYDTNAASEAMKDFPHPRFKAWMATCLPEDIYFSTPGEAELIFGLVNESERKNKLLLKLRIEGWLQSLHEGHILPFDREAAWEYGNIKFTRKKMGRRLDDAIDLQIAAIARVHGMAVVTRNVKDFELVGLEIINPWQAETEIREVPTISYISGLAA